MNDFEQQIANTRQHIPAIERALLDTYFSGYDQEFLQTERGKTDIDNNVFKRYELSLRHVLPWLRRHIELNAKNVLEIGCGTGSSTAALAHYVGKVVGYDIHSLAVEGARKRMEIMDLHNVHLHIIEEETLISRIRKDTEDKYDIILLFAVLEHQTIEERHDTLKACWELLARDGIMAVIDTPNILHYFDLHTSQLPFLHMLPDRLYAKYAVHSPRPAFAGSFKNEQQKSAEQLEVQISRWGRGASYHDFELALGKDFRKYLVAEGFEPEILNWFSCTPEEELLRWYVQFKNYDIPIGFTRCVLNLIMKKHTDRTRPDPALFEPPALSFFTPDRQQRIRALEKQLQEKETLIKDIYRSKTWQLGNLFATPYRKIRNIIKS